MALQTVHPDPEPKGAPRSIRSASVPPVRDVATVEGVPNLATGKNRSVTYRISSATLRGVVFQKSYDPPTPLRRKMTPKGSRNDLPLSYSI